MRKLILAGMALAMLAIPASASAAVERCKVTATVPSTTPSVTTATFTALQPRGTTHQFDDVWRHEFKVTVNANGTFEGTGETFANDGSTIIWAETITGSFDADSISFKTLPVGGGATFKVTDAPFNEEVDVDDEGTWDTNSIEMMISKPVSTTVTGGPTTTTTEYKNHGEYVSSLGGGKIAAQACAGMPTISTQGK
jgi:hypothetical protein